MQGNDTSDVINEKVDRMAWKMTMKFMDNLNGRGKALVVMAGLLEVIGLHKASDWFVKRLIKNPFRYTTMEELQASREAVVCYLKLKEFH